MEKFISIFGRRSGVIIGMVHVKALPGTPKNCQKIPQIIESALKEAEIYAEAGLDAVMLENMHDVPYLPPDSIGPEVTASMTAVASSVKQSFPNLPCGVQVLTAANNSALAIAQAAGLDFIRAEGFVFSHIADEGLLNACAGQLLRYRRQIGADNVLIFTDIKKKHSSHSITADVSIAEMAHAAEFFSSDGIIVTGTETGNPVNKQDLKDVQQTTKAPILIGSGVTASNVSDYITANALIVGSHFKQDGLWSNEVEPETVSTFMKLVREMR